MRFIKLDRFKKILKNFSPLDFQLNQNRKKGAATLEYVLVSTFAAVATITALAILGGVISEKIESLSEKIDTEIEDLNSGSFGSGQP